MKLDGELLLDVSHLYNTSSFSGIQRVLKDISEYQNLDASFLKVVESCGKLKVQNEKQQKMAFKSSSTLPPFIIGVWVAMRSLQNFLARNNLSMLEHLLRRVYDSGVSIFRHFRTRKWNSVNEISNSVILIANPIHSNKEINFWLNIRRNSDCQLAVLVHDLLPVSRPSLFPSSRIESFKKYLDFCLSADYIFFVSKKTQSEFLSYHHGAYQKESEIVIPNGLRPTHPESRLLCRDQDILPNILCVSTFEPRKNHLLLLEASSILWKRGIKFTLTLAGSSGWSNSPIHEEILRVQSNFPRNLVVVENPTDEELEQCYLGSSFCVYPAIDEGFGIPVVESILFNRKIVSNPVPSLHLLSKEDYFQLDGTLETLISGISHGIQNFLGAEVRSELDLPVLGEQVYLGCQKLII